MSQELFNVFLKDSEFEKLVSGVMDAAGVGHDDDENPKPLLAKDYNTAIRKVQDRLGAKNFWFSTNSIEDAISQYMDTLPCPDDR